jgi:uncharacterized LabA/DUF88 family protein
MRVAVYIDGGHVRACAKKADKPYTSEFVRKIAHASVDAAETLHRILYYDCASYSGKAKLPVSGGEHVFAGGDGLLRQLAAIDLFAVRQGVLKFRGWKPKKIPIVPVALTDADFAPDFEQKGVDMRIGLDMATACNQRAVDRIILVTGDTDCVPAMKHVRKAGLQVVIVVLPNVKSHQELRAHADYERKIAWP